MISHKVEKDGGIYFGPYQMSLRSNRNAATHPENLSRLKMRKNETRACFTTISDNALVVVTMKFQRRYDARKSREIQRFLNGDVKTIKDDLAAKMNEASEDSILRKQWIIVIKLSTLKQPSKNKIL